MAGMQVMKVGDAVPVYYDGKMGRGVTGKVLKRRAQGVLVEFHEWAPAVIPPPKRSLWFRRIEKRGVWLGWWLVTDIGQPALLEDSYAPLGYFFGLKGDPYYIYAK